MKHTNSSAVTITTEASQSLHVSRRASKLSSPYLRVHALRLGQEGLGVAGGLFHCPHTHFAILTAPGDKTLTVMDL